MMLKTYSIATSLPNCFSSLSPMNFSALLNPVVGGPYPPIRILIGSLIFTCSIALLSILRRAIWPSRTGVIDSAPAVTEDNADEQACQRSQNFTGWNFTSGMAGPRRPRCSLSPDRALRLGRRDLQSFLDAGSG